MQTKRSKKKLYKLSYTISLCRLAFNRILSVNSFPSAWLYVPGYILCKNIERFLLFVQEMLIYIRHIYCGIYLSDFYPLYYSSLNASGQNYNSPQGISFSRETVNRRWHIIIILHYYTKILLCFFENVTFGSLIVTFSCIFDFYGKIY